MDEWRPYVSAAERKRRVARKLAKMRKAGKRPQPIETSGGRTITHTFWGGAWCTNLESYSDYANRLPRGRTYVRNGSVFDLRIGKGHVKARVSGSEFYTVEISIKALGKNRWEDIKARCGGHIDSMVELLRGQLSTGVMQIVTRPGEGLFPAPAEISLSCSCPDWASMCKHVAAALYGVGVRLDEQPELLFQLRDVDPSELIAAAVNQPASAHSTGAAPTLAADDMAAIFGIDFDMGPALDPQVAASATKTTVKSTPKKAPAKKLAKKAQKRTIAKKVARKAPVKKAPVKKAPVKKAPVKKAPAKQAPAKQAPAKQAPAKKSGSKRLLVALLLCGLSACRSGPAEPQHRDRAKDRDSGCVDPNKPSAYFYPAENRTDYKPDHPVKDGCEILVPDHLFCCPDQPRPTDR